jgi:hypothetical protein
MLRLILVLVLVSATLACGSGETSGPAVGVTPAEIATVQRSIVAAVAQDARLAAQTPLGPADYAELGGRLAGIDGVEAAAYAGDVLGTVHVKVKGGGIIEYRHVLDSYRMGSLLPPEADFRTQAHPIYNAGWGTSGVDAPVAAAPPSRAAALTAAGTYASSFPVASIDPDPFWLKDDGLVCPVEGKIAIVDFARTESTPSGLYQNEFSVDGAELYRRIELMADAAGFTVDKFFDNDINLTNFTKLEDYTIVFILGHGGMPVESTTTKFGQAMPTLWTAETWSDTNRIATSDPVACPPVGYDEAWTKGLIRRGSGTPERVKWTPRLLRDCYRPKVPQLVLLNSCDGLLSHTTGWSMKASKWQWTDDTTFPIYNFGDGLREAGVPVVFGYLGAAAPVNITMNTMTFFRRMFGAYSPRDVPPPPPATSARHAYWPTCMGAQTYFRDPATPEKRRYQLKVRPDPSGGTSVYAGYWDEDNYKNMTFRKVCQGAIPHAYLQELVLTTGAPAITFTKCWDDFWSRGEYPSAIYDTFCGSSDEPTTLDATTRAACAVKIARNVSDAILATALGP